MKTNPNVFRALRGQNKKLTDYLLENNVTTYYYKMTERYDMVIRALNEEGELTEYLDELYATKIEIFDEERNEFIGVVQEWCDNWLTAYRTIPWAKETIRKYENKLYPTETTEYKSYKKKIVTKEIKEAIEYFNGFWEGDNITITADFLDFAETLKELL